MERGISHFFVPCFMLEEAWETDWYVWSPPKTPTTTILLYHTGTFFLQIYSMIVSLLLERCWLNYFYDTTRKRPNADSKWWICGAKERLNFSAADYNLDIQPLQCKDVKGSYETRYSGFRTGLSVAPGSSRARRWRHITVLSFCHRSRCCLFLTPVFSPFMRFSLFQGADIFAAKINIEVQRASEGAIAAIERNGGVITNSFYDPISLGN